MIMTLKQKKIKFKPRINLNHNIYVDSQHTWNRFILHVTLFFFKLTVTAKRRNNEALSTHFLPTKVIDCSFSACFCSFNLAQ